MFYNNSTFSSGFQFILELIHMLVEASTTVGRCLIILLVNGSLFFGGSLGAQWWFRSLWLNVVERHVEALLIFVQFRTGILKIQFNLLLNNSG